jgi:ABC-type sugar transport system permease subunit
MPPTVAVAARAGPQSRGRRLTPDALLGYALVVPSVVWILGIIVYPVFFNVWVSLHRMSMVETDAPFTGLDNYAGVLGSPEFWTSFRLTCVWTFGSLLVIVPAGLGLALLLDQPLRGLRHVRTWILLPWMFPVIVITLMWRWILDPVVGVLNACCSARAWWRHPSPSWTMRTRCRPSSSSTPGAGCRSWPS